MTPSRFPTRTLTVLFLAVLATPPALAVPGGQLGTMPGGAYHCDRPGRNVQLDSIRVPEEDFVVVGNSSYEAGGKRGSYLLLGDRMVMTSGPFDQKRYHRTSSRYLRLVLPDGTDGPVRCVRRF